MTNFLNTIAIKATSTKKLMLSLVMIVTFTSPSFATLQKDDNRLSEVPNSHFDSFLLSDYATLPATKKIFISDVSASFANSWMIEFKRSTRDVYRERILREYSEMLKQHIESQLISSGWEVVQQQDQDAIEISAQLKDLYINGPERLNRQHMLLLNIGYSSIEFVVNDIENQPIIVIEDHRNTGGGDDFIEVNDATNFSWFNKLTSDWAKMFVAYLDMTTSAIKGNSEETPELVFGYCSGNSRSGSESMTLLRSLALVFICSLFT